MYSNTAQKIKSQIKTARNSDMGKISFLITDRKVPGLNGKCRDTLMFLVALAKIGYTEIVAHVAAICNAIETAGGCSISERSVRRSFSQLETLGFISRKKFCYGTNRYQTHIILHLDRFEWWLNKKKAQTPQITHSRPKWPDTPMTSNNNTLCNSKNSFIYSNSKPVEKSTNKTKKPYSNWLHPVLYSVIQSAKRLKVPAVMLKYVIATCEAEITGEKIGFESQTGIEWNRSQWQKMTISEREAVARIDILPRLIPQFFEKKAVIYQENKENEKNECSVSVEESEKIRELIRKSIESTNVNPSEKAVCHYQPPPAMPAVVLGRSELEILISARSRALSRKAV